MAREIVELLQSIKDKSDTTYDEINWRAAHLYDMDKVELHHEIKTNIINGIIAKVKERIGELE